MGKKAHCMPVEKLFAKNNWLDKAQTGRSVSYSAFFYIIGLWTTFNW